MLLGIPNARRKPIAIPTRSGSLLRTTWVWRKISNTLAKEIDNGVFRPGDRLPASPDLAARFGVNRHAVLKAISHLQDEGLVRQSVVVESMKSVIPTGWALAHGLRKTSSS
jgi:DNA-binding transcriptional MocR family regulator